MTPITPGEALRRHRAVRGLSARGLSELFQAAGLEIDRTRLTNLELGRGRPLAVAEWLGMAEALGISPIDLLTGPGASDGEVVEVGRKYQVEQLRTLLGTPTAPTFGPRQRASVEDLLSIAFGPEDIRKVLKVLDAVDAGAAVGAVHIDLISMQQEADRGSR